jgi:pimeloyl-ACP methyl ester carboxylesterase
VLDAYEISAAHVVGVSAGGAFAQLLALEFAERVGHGVDRADWAAISRGILDHTASADRASGR